MTLRTTFKKELPDSKSSLRSLSSNNPFRVMHYGNITAQKLSFSVNGFFSKCEQIRSFLRFFHIFLRPPKENKFGQPMLIMNAMYFVFL